MHRIAVLLWLTLCLSFSGVARTPGERQDKLEALAARGHIQGNAPVRSDAEITIRASPEKLWQILTGINQWPTWQSNVSAAHINGPVEPGTTFTWSNGGTQIQSRIAFVRHNQQIGWTGTVFKARAIHIWSFQPLPNGNTVVKTSESMSGFLLSAFYSSKNLAKANNMWLLALKRKAEE